jgi:hypothetical protein
VMIRRVLSDADPCGSAIYGPVRFDISSDRYLMTMIDRFSQFQVRPFMHTERIADRVYLSKLIDGQWSEPRQIIGRETFGWMMDPVYLCQVPAAYVSAIGTGQVWPDGGKLRMRSSVTINDTSVATEPRNELTVYGPAWSPWPNDVVMEFWAPVSDPFDWHVVENPYGRNTGNRALDAAVAYALPTAIDTNPSHCDFKGITHWDQHASGYAVYHFWGPTIDGHVAIVYGMARATSTGIEVWDSYAGRWDSVAAQLSGSLLYDRADKWHHAQFVAPPRGIIDNPDPTVFGSNRYVIPLTDSTVDGALYSSIAYQTIDDLSNPSTLTPMQRVELPPPYDGSVPNAITDPWLHTDGWWWASWMDSQGRQLCPAGKIPYTAGLGIYASLTGQERRRSA